MSHRNNSWMKVTRQGENSWLVEHNGAGGLNFTARSIVDDATARLLTVAIEAGKAEKLAELREALGLNR